MLLALVAACILSVAVPSQANAYVSYFNCVAFSSGQWCDGRGNGSYDGENSWEFVDAANPGGGTYEVCARIYKPSSGGWLGNISCGYNYTYYLHDSQVMCVCYDAQIRQNSGSPNSIDGYADSDIY